MCVDSNLISLTVSRGHMDSSQSPVNVSFTSSRTTTSLPGSKRYAVTAVTDEGELMQTSSTDIYDINI